MLSPAIVAHALTKMFRPWVKTLLRLGIPYRACADALRWTYVEVASHDFAMDAQRQSKSRVAVITGLSRVEVERLQREPALDATRDKNLLSRAGRVLQAWRMQPNYLDAHRKPKVLALEAEDGESFAALVQAHSGGATLRSVLDELLHKGAVRLENQRVHFVDPNLLVSANTEEQLSLLSTSVADLSRTMERNFTATDRYLQAYDEHEQVPVSVIPALRALVHKKSAEFMDEFDALVLEAQSQAIANNTTIEATCERLGIGFYYFQAEPKAAAVQFDQRGRKAKSNPDYLARDTSASTQNSKEIL